MSMRHTSPAYTLAPLDIVCRRPGGIAAALLVVCAALCLPGGQPRAQTPLPEGARRPAEARVAPRGPEGPPLKALPRGDATPPSRDAPRRASPPPNGVRAALPIPREGKAAAGVRARATPAPPAFRVAAWLRERHLADEIRHYRRLRRDGLVVLAAGTALAVAFAVCAAVGRVRSDQLRNRIHSTFDMRWWVEDAYAASVHRYEKLELAGFIGLGLSLAGLVIPGGSMAIHGHRMLKEPGAWMEHYAPPEPPFRTFGFTVSRSTDLGPLPGITLFSLSGVL